MRQHSDDHALSIFIMLLPGVFEGHCIMVGMTIPYCEYTCRVRTTGTTIYGTNGSIRVRF